MKIKLYFEKENLIRLAVAMVFAAVMFAVIRFPVWVLFGFGVLYFGIKSLKIELNEKTVLEIGKLLNFTVTPVFRYGNSPIDDPVNYPPIYGETVTGWVNPVVVKIDKSSSLNEHETATGSNFPFSYFVNINIANGAKIENITITDVIPSDVMYLGSPVLYDSKGRVIDSGLYTIEEPAGIPLRHFHA